MQILNVNNPYQAPVFFVEQCDSTQLEARSLIAKNPMSGTVVVTNYQAKGRGRGTARLWKAEAGENLLFTIMFHYENFGAIPRAFTLRIGLAVAEAIADFVPALKNHITVKWPNDVMIGSRKVCGILAENVGSYILTGIGINVNQLEFPEEINKKAVSIRQALSEKQSGTVPVFETHTLLETILPHLQKKLSSSTDNKWNAVLQERLYKRGELVSFVPGQVDSKGKVEGVLEGIGSGGELLINTGTEIKTFITGELEYQFH
ncbi:MAG: biotin--[acetyl-CoA-carboxylase] ligase [Treponema sp.]|jgi:BirA family biotin operon repressor/biotin-[acetyl-CoA-carboxylase] ligase|nr:biotin--[acetyl-CoA-carboxylase] ligase [Treponema sp.]